MITAYVYFGPKISELGNIGVTLSKTGWGERYCCIGDFDSKPHENIIKHADRTEVTCSFTPDQGRREKGIYRSGKITAELDRSIMDKDRDYVLTLKGQGYCLREMGALYHEIRAGNVKPSPRDSYDKVQCKEDPRIASVLIRKMKDVLERSYFWPWGSWVAMKNIVRHAESEIPA